LNLLSFLLLLLLLLCICVLCYLFPPGICTLVADLTPTTPFAASGAVCNGWEKPVADLIDQGLAGDVIRRLNALAQAERTVYVAGHSRGGALVGGRLMATAHLCRKV
jgi:hypothetical protein